ncbi:MAG: hypothetical protein Q8N63_06315 [Nanoarchaeota archaeon]|nr:hypothetical protein [Nanoarchaeota archaeon]
MVGGMHCPAIAVNIAIKRSFHEVKIWAKSCKDFPLNRCYVWVSKAKGCNSPPRICEANRRVEFEFYSINFCEADYILGHARFFVSFFLKKKIEIILGVEKIFVKYLK